MGKYTGKEEDMAKFQAQKKQTHKELKNTDTRHIHEFVVEGSGRRWFPPHLKICELTTANRKGLPLLKKNETLHSNIRAKASILLEKFE